MRRDRFLTANRLRHHVVEWSDAGPLVLLLHGFLEHAHAWDVVAPRLAEAGFRVVALDWRGHGDSEWIGAGGYYHFADYVADLGGLVRTLGGPVALVAHSMAANAALLYAGTEPERVAAVACVDALGPPDRSPDIAPGRFAGWLSDLDRVAGRDRAHLSLDEATARLHERFPRWSAEVARHMAEHATRADGDARVWKFDPLHQTASPQPFYAAQARAFWRRVACPVLYLEGEETAFRLAADDLAERLAALRAMHVTIPACGHHPHLERPDAFVAAIVPFLRDAAR